MVAREKNGSLNRQPWNAWTQKSMLAFVLQMRHNGFVKTAVVHARMEPGTKRGAECVLLELGLSPTEAIRIFYRQIMLRRGLPFSVSIPNATTTATLEASRRGKGVQEFESLDAMFESWEK